MFRAYSETYAIPTTVFGAQVIATTSGLEVCLVLGPKHFHHVPDAEVDEARVCKIRLSWFESDLALQTVVRFNSDTRVHHAMLEEPAVLGSLSRIRSRVEIPYVAPLSHGRSLFTAIFRGAQ